ncbi:hypothetical protein RJZ57_008620, partial [Blastomyces gilchristii]
MISDHEASFAVGDDDAIYLLPTGPEVGKVGKTLVNPILVADIQKTALRRSE